ncbi:hypothetical protein L1987_49098 [Smallanthus sonchifolius]|uniref:Uncharacterized protein n=1 Tax=Smallanthus sonchifolius TaxID=185202 RepID=A0ACB9FTT4_9ASTR|nr:hypothetical protein L1987_49098 [Smallanthus sonchifolius]
MPLFAICISLESKSKIIAICISLESKSKIIALWHIGRRDMIKREDGNRKPTRFERKEQVDDTPIEHTPTVSWEYLSKMERFIITFQNGKSETLFVDRLVSLVPDDLQALIDLPLINELKYLFGDYVIELIKRKLEDLSSDDNLGDNESEESSQFFRNEKEEDSSDTEQDQTVGSQLNREENCHTPTDGGIIEAGHVDCS